MFIAPIPKDYRSSFRSEMLIDKLKCVFGFKWNLVFAVRFSHSAPKGACLVESVVEVYKHFTPKRGLEKLNSRYQRREFGVRRLDAALVAR